MRSYLKDKVPWLWRLLRRFRHPVWPMPVGLWLLNFIVQRVFRVNSDTPWQVHYTSSVMRADKISLGKDVWISFASSGACYIQGDNGIEIGDNTIFGPGIKIISTNHDIRSLNTWMGGKPIRIGERCWIGANAVILPEVALGDGCVVGAGSVVTKSFESGSIIAGVPARIIGRVPSQNI